MAPHFRDFLYWFPATLLAGLLLWPLSIVILAIDRVFDDLRGLLQLLAAPFISLPFTLPVLFFVTIVTFVPAAIGWLLVCRLAERSHVFGKKVAVAAAIAAVACALVTMAGVVAWLGQHAAIRSSGFLGRADMPWLMMKAALFFGGPVAAVAGPILAVLITGKRFQRAPDWT